MLCTGFRRSQQQKTPPSQPPQKPDSKASHWRWSHLSKQSSLDFLTCPAELEHFHCSSGRRNFSKPVGFLQNSLKCCCSQSKMWRCLLLFTKSFLLSGVPHSQSQLVWVSSSLCLRSTRVFVLPGRSAHPWEAPASAPLGILALSGGEKRTGSSSENKGEKNPKQLGVF